MIPKEKGRQRVHTLLHKAGYGGRAAQRVAEGAGSEHHEDIAASLHAEGGKSKHRFDKAGRHKATN